ncbi:hypothetical protein AAFF_G00288250, partial [Aldrovandia affinis]
GVGCRVGQGSVSCWTPLQDWNEAEGGLWEEGGSPQGDWSSRPFGKGQPSSWISGGAGGAEAEVDWASWCCSSSPPDARSPCSILAHTGLPGKGSLDYPDAPPSTPLLPEMLKSQGSFHSQLKGGLAKEFLPAPPPSTPKNLPSLSEGDGPGLEDDRSEFVLRLIRSLSLECSERRLLGVEEEERADGAQDTDSNPQERPKLSAYTAQLLAKIISSGTANCMAPSEVESAGTSPAEHLQLAAERWANEVIEASFLEMVTEGERGRAGSGHPVRQPAEALSTFAGRLIADALQQARAELGPHPVQEMAEELSDDIMAWAIATATQQQGIRQESPGSQEGSHPPTDGKPEVKTRASDDGSGRE